MATAKNNKKGKKINDTTKKTTKSSANTTKKVTTSNKPKEVIKNKVVKEKKEEKVTVAVKETVKPIKKEKNLGWLWIFLGIVLPPVGIILYFVWKDKKKQDALKAGKAGLAALCVWLFVGMSFILSDKGGTNTNLNGTELKTVDVKLASDTIKNWYNDLNSGRGVVTVIASSTCPHCKNYKPIITEVCEKENIKLYFFESDELSEDDYTILTNSINLKNYKGYVPYTFVVKDRNFVLDHTGEQDETTTRDMLKEAGLLEG